MPPAEQWTTTGRFSRTIVYTGATNSLVVDLLDLLGQFHVPAHVFARLALGTAPAVVGGGVDGRFPQYSLDPQMRVLVDEHRHLGRPGCTSDQEPQLRW
ncbi:hypothetical protein OG342_00185 [Streptomyces bobili]|uniref:hypothetical protein n=1 Tax=Streptomyces bobili TaxID=67280 RepID=UPI00225952C5|nr:hypothetical protein [Streptomyces bobili]MCX5521319.1 hypothetical protein [Streptomyces bobili]